MQRCFAPRRLLPAPCGLDLDPDRRGELHAPPAPRRRRSPTGARADRDLREHRVLSRRRVTRASRSRSRSASRSAGGSRRRTGSPRRGTAHTSRLAPERRDRAEVVRRCRSGRRGSCSPCGSRRATSRDQLLLLRLRDLRVEGEEDLRAEQVVARRVAVGARGRRRRRTPRATTHDERAAASSVRPGRRAATVNGAPPRGAIAKESPQCPTMTSAGADVRVDARATSRAARTLLRHLHVEHREGRGDVRAA